MAKDINIGSIEVFTDEDARHQLKRICSCGHKHNAEYLTRIDIPKQHECENCGSRNFYGRNKFPTDQRKAIPTLFDVESTGRGFDFKKTNLSVVFHSETETIEVIQPNMIRRFVFDWVDSVLKVYKNEELEYDRDWEASIEKEDTFGRVSRYLSTGMTDQQELITTLNLENHNFYRYLSSELAEDSSGYYPRKRNFLAVLYEALVRKGDFNWVQILSNAGYEGFPKGQYYRVKYSIDRQATKPNKILGVPKKVANVIREIKKIDYYHLDIIQDVCKNGGHMKYFYALFDSLPDKSKFYSLVASLTQMIGLITTYGYEPSSLIGYLFEEIYLYQGITSPITGYQLLRDYIRMSTEMSIPFEKYPRSLKREHDVVNINYNVFIQDKEVEDFREAMLDNDYLTDMDSNSDFCVLLPETSQDLITEGGKLSHCVGSYVSAVKQGRTVIAFLREKQKMNTPLITIEVSGHRIIQARGSHNRGVTKREKQYLLKWAEERQLQYI